MIGWQNVAAFWVLPILAAPILIHFLRRHRAERVPFPSLRFVRASPTAAVQFRRPADWILLALRVSVLALAVVALARPLLLTESRLSNWNASTARAVVVDTSESMRAQGGDGTAPERLAAEAAEAETKTAEHSRRFDVRILEEGLARAEAWLASTPPSRKEVVVISDFQRGALDSRVIGSLSETVGIRLVSVGDAVAQRRVAGVALLGAGPVPPRAQTIELSADTTAVTIEERRASDGGGIRILAGAESDTALRAVARAGAPAGSAEQPIAIRFAGAGAATLPAALTPVRTGWMLRTVLGLQTLGSGLGFQHGTARLETGDPSQSTWTIVSRDSRGAVVVAAAASGQELFLDVAAPADSLLAAAVIRAALDARVAARDYGEQEIARAEPAALTALNRPAAPVESGAWRRSEATDARWCWLIALVLLGIEQWLRSRPHGRAAEEATRVAA